MTARKSPGAGGLLRRSDAEILKAESGKRALELLLEHEVALALIDVQMPELDGFALAELMRNVERTREIPIIFVTAGLHDRDRVFKGYESGAVDFLVSPSMPASSRARSAFSCSSIARNSCSSRPMRS